ncbi:hypothetical protein Q31b_53240 [Novipirellula aureliae]|uniref:HEAT repeat protein n=1 Tax=Novipirellula aureliae TaxID=2527966 RepID=A0A5C6DEW0_9BACT|nr:HEAT repeat domain-containing protein [Novipirellula aureliae]TWU35228.1 hypothetical protein Q31b_53240 [Novipirellula aureliae]
MTPTETAIKELASKDGVVRERARKALVATKGHEVVHALIGELVDPQRQVRWEAAKTLSEIADPVAAIPLVHAMHDGESDVAWVAAEGVARMGMPGLMAVLSGLTRASFSLEYCKAAHHSLKRMKKSGKQVEEIDKVLAALEGAEPKLTAPIAAHHALQAIRAR